MAKNIYDYKHVKSVAAIALYKNGKTAGKIICNWSDNPAGSVCTAQVMLWDGKISEQVKQVPYESDFLTGDHPILMIGRAGGYGYDKRSSAIAAALRKGGIHHLLPVEGGSGNEGTVFTAAGFEWFEII